MENFMNYYKDTIIGEVYAYDDEQVEGGFVREGLVAMIPAEVEEHKNPKIRRWNKHLPLNGTGGDNELNRADIQLNKIQTVCLIRDYFNDSTEVTLEIFQRLRWIPRDFYQASSPGCTMIYFKWFILTVFKLFILLLGLLLPHK